MRSVLRRPLRRGKLAANSRKDPALTDQAVADAAVAQEVARDHGLVRAVGTWGLTASIVNGVVGAGIFSLPAAMALAAGSNAPLAYLACTIAMGAVVICFAEASSRLPTSGGSYGFIGGAFGPLAGFVAGVLLWISSILACGGIAAAFASGVGEIVPVFRDPWAQGALAVAVIATLAWINIAGVAKAAGFIGVATVIKLVPLALFVVVGALALPGIHAGPPPPPLSGGFGRALILAIFALCGMETPLATSGEVIAPQRTIPKALFLSMGFVALLYIAIQLVAQGLLGADLGTSQAPLAEGIARVGAPLGLVLVVGAALSRLGWIATDLFGSPRVLFAFARDGLLPRRLGEVDTRTHTPKVAIIVHSALVALLAVTGTFEQLVVLSALATAALYFMACAAAWRLARTKVAAFGAPLAFRALPLAAVAGMASMVVLVAFARWIEMAGLIATVAASALYYYAVTRRTARAAR